MPFQPLSRIQKPHKPHPQLTTPPCEAEPSIAGEVETVAGAIEAAGMAVPATLALQVGKPLLWIGGQMLWMLQPFVEGLGVGSRKSSLSVQGLAHLLESDSGVDSLVERLDAGAGKSGAPRSSK